MSLLSTVVSITQMKRNKDFSFFLLQQHLSKDLLDFKVHLRNEIQGWRSFLIPLKTNALALISKMPQCFWEEHLQSHQTAMLISKVLIHKDQESPSAAFSINSDQKHTYLHNNAFILNYKLMKVNQYNIWNLTRKVKIGSKSIQQKLLL